MTIFSDVRDGEITRAKGIAFIYVLNRKILGLLLSSEADGVQEVLGHFLRSFLACYASHVMHYYLGSSHLRDEYIVRKYLEKCWTMSPSIPTVPPNKGYRIEERAVVQLLQSRLVEMVSLDPQILRCRFETPLKSSRRCHRNVKSIVVKQRGMDNAEDDVLQGGAHQVDSKHNYPDGPSRTVRKVTTGPALLEPLLLDCLSPEAPPKTHMFFDGGKKFIVDLVSVRSIGVQTD